MLNEDQIPEGYMQNAQGCLVPRANIRPIDIERDALVNEKMEKIKALQAEMRAVKGNVQLLSFDGKYKLCRDYGQMLAFDEGLQAAKELIDGCLRRWCADSRPELRAVVEQAFKVDKKGRINTGAVLGLRRIEIDDPDWQEAMRAITESLQVLDSRVYVRAYERNASGAYQPISLDFANV